MSLHAGRPFVDLRLQQILIDGKPLSQLGDLLREYIAETDKRRQDDQRKQQHADAGGDRFAQSQTAQQPRERFDNPEYDEREEHRSRQIVQKAEDVHDKPYRDENNGDVERGAPIFLIQRDHLLLHLFSKETSLIPIFSIVHESKKDAYLDTYL